MIIPVNQQHLPEILRLEKTVFPQPWSNVHFRMLMDENGPVQNLIYSVDGEVAGYLFGSTYPDYYYLKNLAVGERFRRRKIASRLLDYTVNQVRENNINSIVLEVSAENENARCLYESNGFIAIGKEKDYYTKGDDAIVYVLELA